jgi:hypothetical protein
VHALWEVVWVEKAKTSLSALWEVCLRDVFWKGEHDNPFLKILTHLRLGRRLTPFL